jgi:hypothetical protein
MTKLTQADVDRLLDQTFYSLDTTTMLSGVIDFLEFSEGNLSWQRRREMRKAKHEGDTIKFDLENQHLEAQYRHHLIENVEYWFDVSLSQRIRYAGLVAFVTTLEWCSKGLAKQFTLKPPKVPNKENRHVHFLAHIDELSSSGFRVHIDNVRKLVRVRDCIVHSAGFLEGHKFDKDIRDAARALKGFSIWDENLLGKSVRIEQGAVERYASNANEWVPKLVERCVKAGLVK